jgi:hypothetical protein
MTKRVAHGLVVTGHEAPEVSEPLQVGGIEAGRPGNRGSQSGSQQRRGVTTIDDLRRKVGQPRHLSTAVLPVVPVRLGVKGSQVQILSARPIDTISSGLVRPRFLRLETRPSWGLPPRVGPHLAPTRPKRASCLR